jgi:membrane protease YdiL (CAAX protease family)
VVSEGFIYTWFRLKSGSLWTGVMLHASHNLFVQSFFTPLTIVNNSRTNYFIDEFGAVLAIVTLFGAIYFWTRRKEVHNA